MTQPVFPFSVPDSDKEGLALVLFLKEESKRTGKSFSRYVMDALKTTYEVPNE